MTPARHAVPRRAPALLASTLLALALSLGACAQGGGVPPTAATAGGGPVVAAPATVDNRTREQMDLDAYGPRRPLAEALGLNRSPLLGGGGGGGGGGGSYGYAPPRNPNAGMPFGMSPGLGAVLFGRI